MARTPRQFVPLDMNYLRDPSIQRAGPEAELLYLRALAHCKSGGTAGRITRYDLDVISVRLTKVPSRVAALVREHLWIEVDDGWRIRSWDAWNLTADQIADEQAKKRAAAVLGNHRRWHVDKTDPDCTHCQPQPTQLESRREGRREA